ncbi:TetR/AcrR family transcriptional regulator [Marinilabilia sp.]|uniref:TetR/AcrR family transcriptional regulator n=1 Tax=Marinilabilia sp. TaxID=2021252 RepID=UPI0025BEB739|nr:TetR/AcrR family transcriptional regulator [Marinilabilia sp.]
MLSERQEQIIEASIGLIDRLGIQGFTIKNLSKEIGISEPAIYRHFDSKMEILATILDGFLQRVSLYHKEKSAAQLPARERMELFFKMIFNVFADNPTLISVIFAEEIFRNEPALSQKVMEIQQINEKELGAIISEIALKEDLTGTPVETLVMMFFGPVRLLARKWKMQDCRFDLREEGDQLIQTIIKMISL